MSLLILGFRLYFSVSVYLNPVQATKDQMATGKVHHAVTAKRDWCLLAIVYLIFSVSTIAWTISNQSPPSWDPADHIRFGYEYYRPLSRFDIYDFLTEIFSTTHYYPPFYHLLIALLFLVTGPSILGAIAANLFLLALLIFSIYRIGVRLYSAEAGMIAAIILPTYHVNAALLHEGYLDFALMSLVGISLYLLYESDHFKRRSYSLLFGASLGLGMLCKQPYLFFLSLPTAYLLVSAVRERSSGALKNALFAMALASLITASWYLPHLEDIMEIYQINRNGAVVENEPPLLSFISNLGYINALASGQLQLPFFILFLVGLAASIFWYRRESLPLYLCIAGGLTAFTFIANKDLRYTIPYMPAVALLSTCWLGRVKAVWIKGIFITLFLLLGALSFTQAQWPIESNDIYFDTTYFRWTILGKNYLHFDRQPSTDEWALPGILKVIGRQSSGQRGIIRVGIVPNMVHLNPSSFALHTQIHWNYYGADPYIRTKWLIDTKSWRQVKRCRYVVVRERVDPDVTADRFESRFNEWVRSRPDRFVEVGRVPITSLNTYAVIYEQALKKRDKHAPTTVVGVRANRN
jgi:4-amino-4-deoxy-L-arabinose transferase-like glycosyltransferase